MADELNIDKQKVYRYIRKNHIHEELRSELGVMYYSKNVEELIKTVFKDKDHELESSSLVVEECLNDDGVLAVLKTTIDTLQKELDIKNKQIEELTAELVKEREHSREQSEKMVVLADQAQKLQLAQMKPQLTDGGADPQAETPLQEKPSFFYRIFGK